MYHLADFAKENSKKKNNSLRNKLLAGTAVAAIGGAGLLVALKSKRGGKKVIGVGSKPTVGVVEEVAKTKPIVPLPKEVAPITVKPKLSTRARNALARGALQKKTVGVKGFQYIANGKVVRVKGFNRQQLKKVLQQTTTKVETKTTPSQIEEIVIGLNGNTAKRKAVGIQRVNLSSKQLNKLAANREKASKSVSNKVRNADTKGVISRNLASTSKEDIPQVIIQSSARVKQGTSPPRVIGLLPAAGQTSSPVNLSVNDFLVGLNGKTNKVNNNAIASQLPLITPKLTPQQNRLITANLNNRNPVVTGQYSARNIQGRLIASGRSKKEVAKLISERTKGGRLVRKRPLGTKVYKPTRKEVQRIKQAASKAAEKAKYNLPEDKRWTLLTNEQLRSIGAKHNVTTNLVESLRLDPSLPAAPKQAIEEALNKLSTKVFNNKKLFPVLDIQVTDLKTAHGRLGHYILDDYVFTAKSGIENQKLFTKGSRGIKAFQLDKALFKEQLKKGALLSPGGDKGKLQGVFLHEFSHLFDILQGVKPGVAGYRYATDIPDSWASQLVSKVKKTKRVNSLSDKGRQLMRIDNDGEVFAQVMSQYFAEAADIKPAQYFLANQIDSLYFKGDYTKEWKTIKEFIKKNLADNGNS